MKTTTSSAYIKDIKAQVRLINEALRKVQEAEKIQETALNVREYDKSKAEANYAVADVMAALEEAVRLTSAMGSVRGLYDMHKYHRIAEFDFRDSHK